ncbi:MAG: glycosyltransferase, partial [Phenylobacterium sp.]|uniref:glycosyltransferase n=1 Tax=Phenylobacterium sp. TaxID=1871053 RepID=UPI00273608D7
MTDYTPPETMPADLQRSEADQRAFYDAVMDRTRQALAAAGEIERFISVAGVDIRLIFAGPRLDEEFMPAISHLERGPISAPDATLYVWDSASTGVEMIPPPCPRTSFTDRGDIWGFSSQVVRSAFHWSEYSVNLLDVPSGVGIYWIDTTQNLPYWARSSPMRTLFHWLMEQRGLQLVHAAAIGDADGGVLVTGKGGVGKSSTALAGLAAGMRYIGDDYLVVGLEPEPTAYTLYATAKLEPHQAQRFPELAALAEGQRPAEGEKVVLNLYPSHADQIVTSLPIKWVLTPRFGDGEETTFEPVSAVELHRAAAFTTMSQLPHAGRKTHDFIGRLIAATPRQRIALGRDIPGVPRAIAALLADPNAAQAAAEAPAARQPLVSVIVPVFNGAHFLPEAIASILAQQYPAVEIIVVDDGSSDDIEAAVRALPVDVRFFRQPNQGPSAAR